MIKSILFLLFVVFLLNGCMILNQSSMVFFPSPTLVQTPEDWGLEYKDIFLETEDAARLHGWYIPRQGAKDTLLFFHGNGGNISHRGESIKIFHNMGLNVFILDYRGYGKSEGKPDEKGLYADARAGWKYVTDDLGIDQQSIIIFGRSLGGVVAAHLASEVQPGRLILESTFSSAKDVARELYPIMSRFFVLLYDFHTEEYITKVHCPVLVLHSPMDEIIAFHLGEKVFQAAKEPKTFFTMRGDHNGGFLVSQPGYGMALELFLSTSRP